MSRPWVRLLWWVCCLTFIGGAAFGGRLEDATGLPIGPGSLLLLLVFAAYRGIDWYVYRQEHPEYPMAPTGQSRRPWRWRCSASRQSAPKPRMLPERRPSRTGLAAGLRSCSGS